MTARIDGPADGGVEETKFWLWKNFVDGRPEYWAFRHPYPCDFDGNPLVLGEPCGYAIFKGSIPGRSDRTDDEVIARLLAARRAGP